MNDKLLLNGNFKSKEIDNWSVSWETYGNYRHWCRQYKTINLSDKDILIIMFNPGSLTGNGERLGSDTTLRILRTVFENLQYNCLVTNLFDYSTTKPADLISEKWQEIDREGIPLIYERLNYDKIVAYMFAYGNYETWEGVERNCITKRVKLIKNFLTGIPEIKYIENKDSLTPKHPYTWQTEKLIPTVQNNILEIINNI